MNENEGKYGIIPDGAYFRELRRPWKVATFAVGMAYLLYGALCYDISDWDAGVSFIMGGLTYLLAPWSVHLLMTALRERPRRGPLRVVVGLLLALFVVDWVYWLYHTLVGNRMLRWENFKVSTALYFLCGIFWYYRGSLRDMAEELKGACGKPP